MKDLNKKIPDMGKIVFFHSSNIFNLYDH